MIRRSLSVFGISSFVFRLSPFGHMHDHCLIAGNFFVANLNSKAQDKTSAMTQPTFGLTRPTLNRAQLKNFVSNFLSSSNLLRLIVISLQRKENGRRHDQGSTIHDGDLPFSYPDKSNLIESNQFISAGGASKVPGTTPVLLPGRTFRPVNLVRPITGGRHTAAHRNLEEAAAIRAGQGRLAELVEPAVDLGKSDAVVVVLAGLQYQPALLFGSG